MTQAPVASAPALLSAPSLGLAAAGLILAVSLGPVLVEAPGLRRAFAGAVGGYSAVPDVHGTASFRRLPFSQTMVLQTSSN